MGLNETTKQMRELLAGISVDLEKAASGNKAASQRVRTGTIKMEKTAKNYRRESISAERSGTSPKRASQKKQKSGKANKPAQKAAQKAAPKAAAKSKQAKVKARPKAKALFNPKMMKRPTAKIPYKKM